MAPCGADFAAQSLAQPPAQLGREAGKQVCFPRQPEEHIVLIQTRGNTRWICRENDLADLVLDGPVQPGLCRQGSGKRGGAGFLRAGGRYRAIVLQVMPGHGQDAGNGMSGVELAKAESLGAQPTHGQRGLCLVVLIVITGFAAGREGGRMRRDSRGDEGRRRRHAGRRLLAAQDRPQRVGERRPHICRPGADADQFRLRPLQGRA